MADRSKVVRAKGFRWVDVPIRVYKESDDLYKDVTRQTLLGNGDAERSLNFEMRYFEIAPGGYSTLERHGHPHAVLVVRGRGEVQLDDRTAPIAPFDCVYVAPDAEHQFRAAADESLGFICVVDRERDRPRPVTRSAPR